MSSTVSKKAFGKIRKQEIEPRSRWHFVFRNVVFWVIFIFSVLLGARVFGASLFILLEIEPELFINSLSGFVNLVLGLFPFAWLSAFLLFVLFAMLGLHKTEGGYRISIKKLVLLNLLCVIVLGGVLFATGDGKRFEEQARALPFYTPVDKKREVFWDKSAEGRLVGKVNEVNGQTLVLEDPKRNTWIVQYDDSFDLKVGDKVRILGSIEEGEEENIFQAQDILFWEPRRKPPRKPGMKPGEKINDKNERNFRDLRMKEWRGQST